MKRIYAKAIEMANPFDLQKTLVAIVENVNKSDYGERLLDILFDADIKENELPHVVKRYEETRKRKSFDYLNDRVEYDYEKLNTRYFINEEDALEYSKSGYYDYNASTNALRDGYPYEGNHLVTSSSYCDLYEWMNSEVIEQ